MGPDFADIKIREWDVVEKRFILFSPPGQPGGRQQRSTTIEQTLMKFRSQRITETHNSLTWIHVPVNDREICEVWQLGGLRQRRLISCSLKSANNVFL